MNNCGKTCLTTVSMDISYRITHIVATRYIVSEPTVFIDVERIVH